MKAIILIGVIVGLPVASIIYLIYFKPPKRFSNETELNDVLTEIQWDCEAEELHKR